MAVLTTITFIQAAPQGVSALTMLVGMGEKAPASSSMTPLTSSNLRSIETSSAPRGPEASLVSRGVESSQRSVRHQISMSCVRVNGGWVHRAQISEEDLARHDLIVTRELAKLMMFSWDGEEQKSWSMSEVIMGFSKLFPR